MDKPNFNTRDDTDRDATDRDADAGTAKVPTRHPFVRLARWALQHPSSATVASVGAFAIVFAALAALIVVSIVFDAAREAAESAQIHAESALQAERTAHAATTAALQNTARRELAERFAREKIVEWNHQRERELQQLARAGQIDDLKMALGIRVRGERNPLTIEFERRWTLARDSGIDEKEFIDAMLPADVNRFLAAYVDLVGTHAEFPNDVTLTATDFFAAGILHLWGKGHFAEAEANFSTALARKPIFVRALYNRGWANWRLYRYDSAAADFAAVIEMGDDYFRVRARLGRAVIFVEREDGPAALRELRAASAIDPHDVPPTLVTLLQPFADGNPIGTVFLAQRTVRQDPEKWEAWIVLGVIHRGLGNRSAAETAFGHAIHHAPPRMRSILRGIRDTTQNLTGQLNNSR